LSDSSGFFLRAKTLVIVSFSPIYLASKEIANNGAHKIDLGKLGGVHDSCHFNNPSSGSDCKSIEG